MNENPDVSLVEVIVEKNYDEFNISDFTQAVEGLNCGSWQAPFRDTYLNTIGTQVIGDYFRKPLTKIGITRLAFFIYYLDFSKPLSTPFGKIEMPAKTQIPERIKDKIKYEDPE